MVYGTVALVSGGRTPSQAVGGAGWTMVNLESRLLSVESRQGREAARDRGKPNLLLWNMKHVENR